MRFFEGYGDEAFLLVEDFRSHFHFEGSVLVLYLLLDSYV